MPEKGPPVFLDYDQAALDAAYDQAAYAPNREQLIKRRIRDSEPARHRVYTKAIAAEAGFGGNRLELFRFASAGKRSKTAANWVLASAVLRLGYWGQPLLLFFIFHAADRIDRLGWRRLLRLQ